MPSARVLLVEDEPGLQLALSDRLFAEGYRVETAADGNTAVQRATGEPFDLIILDVMLPGRDGFDVAKTVRQQGIQTPILMLTARTRSRRSRRRTEAGRRRLPHQAIRDDRAAGAPRSAAAPRAGDVGRHARAVSVRRRAGRRAQGGSHRRTAPRSICRRRSFICCATSSSIAARRSRAKSCSRKCGAITPRRRRARSMCTWPGCDRSSSPIRACRSTSSRCTGSATSLSASVTVEAGSAATCDTRALRPKGPSRGLQDRRPRGLRLGSATGRSF